MHIQNFWEEVSGKRSLLNPTAWKDNIKTDIEEIICEDERPLDMTPMPDLGIAGVNRRFSAAYRVVYINTESLFKCNDTPLNVTNMSAGGGGGFIADFQDVAESKDLGKSATAFSV
jgi:hypothetical protein